MSENGIEETFGGFRASARENPNSVLYPYVVLRNVGLIFSFALTHASSHPIIYLLGHKKHENWCSGESIGLLIGLCSTRAWAVLISRSGWLQIPFKCG